MNHLRREGDAEIRTVQTTQVGTNMEHFRMEMFATKTTVRK